MNGFHYGTSPVQSGAQRTVKVGIPPDFHGAKLDRRVLLRSAQKQPEQSLRQQGSENFAILPGMDQ